MIRHATAQDAYAIANIHVASWQTAYAGIVPDSYLQSLSIEQRQQQWQHTLTNGKAITCVLESAGQISGWVCGGSYRDDSSNDAGEIYALYIEPQYWRRGYGQQLLHHIADALTLLNYKPLYLWVLTDNTPARHFYQQQGFSPDGVVKDIVIGDKTLQEMRYRWHKN